MSDDVIKKVRRLVLDEAIRASTEYMKKEQVRQRIQELAASMVANGDIKSDAELADFWKTVEMSIGALRMVPYDVFKGVK
jgi:enoyl-[acyl-carrier-protein] reductase (NADH)